MFAVSGVVTEELSLRRK